MEYIPHNWDAHNRWNVENGDNTHRLTYDFTFIWENWEKL